jgi:hypothetical protein
VAILDVTPIQKAGIVDLTAVLVAADVAGDQYDGSTGTFVAVQNDDASPHTLTVTAPAASATCGNLGALPVADIVLTVAAGDVGLVAIPSGYADQGAYKWSYDDVTSLLVGVFSISP